MKFRVTLMPDFEAGGYIASCPMLPGCHSQGESVEEAIANIQDAIAGYLESLKKHGEPLPMEAEVEVTDGATAARRVRRRSRSRVSKSRLHR